jgi:hypothetical protein
MATKYFVEFGYAEHAKKKHRDYGLVLTGKNSNSHSFADSCTTTTTSFCKGDSAELITGSPLLVLTPLALFEEKKGPYN